MNQLTQIARIIMLNFHLLLMAGMVQAQNPVLFEEPEEWKSFIMDGSNRHQVWARQISPSQLAIGLTDEEGYVSVENDTCIWLKGRYGSPDELFAIVRVEPQEDEFVFLQVARENLDKYMVVDTIGRFNPNLMVLSDKNNNKIASLHMDGNIVDGQTAKLLIKTGNVDTVLSSFFFFWFYQKQRKINQNL